MARFAAKVSQLLSASDIFLSTWGLFSCESYQICFCKLSEYGVERNSLSKRLLQTKLAVVTSRLGFLVSLEFHL